MNTEEKYYYYMLGYDDYNNGMVWNRYDVGSEMWQLYEDGVQDGKYDVRSNG
jgi:hypothetical protein